jgi:hypothetical protein
MKASFELAFDHFVILAADEQHAQASGCSMDDAVRTIKSISTSLELNFFDRTQIAFKKQDTIDLISTGDLKKTLSEGRWNGETLTFNNLLTTKSQLSEWLVPSGTTWLRRYLSIETVGN